jgi:hypothetical protein
MSTSIFSVIKTSSSKRFHSYVLNVNAKYKPNIFKEYDSYYSNENIKPKIDYFWSNEFLVLYYIWIHNCIKNKYISIRNPFTNTIIETNRYFMYLFKKESIYTLVANYNFDNNIIVGLGLGTSLGALETRILYIICLKTKKILYDWKEFPTSIFLNNLHNILNKNINFQKNLKYFNNLNSKVTTLYGYMNNIGHTLFNEMTGLFLLEIQETNKNIDEVLIGSFDFFLTENYYKKYPNIKINKIYKTDLELMEYKGKGVIFKYNHIFISNKCKVFLKDHLKRQIFESKSNILNEIKNIQNHYPIFMIYLRYGKRVIKNQENTLSLLVDKLSEKFPNAFFLFNGFCSNPSLSDNAIIGHMDNDKYNVKECIEMYTAIYNSIISKIKTNNYSSLINLNSFELSEYIDISSYTIYQNTNLATLSSWLYNKPGIILGIENSDISVYKNQDLIINENHPNIIFNENTSKTFDINIDEIFNIIIKNI